MHATKYSPEEKRILLAFGQAMRGLRNKHGWSQEELAEKTDLHRTYIGSVERGERNVSLLNMVNIARPLGVTPTQILEEMEKNLHAPKRPSPIPSE
jgi:transcriptional regulator with XRE-family HTH domain